MVRCGGGVENGVQDVGVVVGEFGGLYDAVVAEQSYLETVFVG